MKKILKKIQNTITELDRMQQNKVVADLEHEVVELKHIFAILSFGNFAAIPTAPFPIAIELLPDCQEEVQLLNNKIATSFNPLSDLFSKLDIE